MEIRFTPASQAAPSELKQLADTMRRRITDEHLKGATVAVSGSSIVARGLRADQSRLTALGTRGILQFRLVLAQGTGGPGDTTGEPTAASPGPSSSPSSRQLAAGLTQTGWEAFLAKDCVKAAQPTLDTDMEASQQIAACSQDGKTKYLLDVSSIDGRDVTAASATPEKTSSEVLTGNWQVNLSLKDPGKTAFRQITAQLAGTGGQFAIVMDGIVYTAPTVYAAIDDGEAQITGNFTQASATDLAAVLKDGVLPVPLVVGDIVETKQ
jgi:preprotein translocase subunit SecD